MDNFIAHILVVDDDDGLRSLVKKYLNVNNYLVTTAINAEDANEKVNIIKFRRRKHSRTQQGHRQWYTEVKITGINAG